MHIQNYNNYTLKIKDLERDSHETSLCTLKQYSKNKYLFMYEKNVFVVFTVVLEILWNL